MSDTSDVTSLLEAHRAGDPEAFGRLVELVYDELRSIGHVQRRKASPGAALQTTALVNELYLKMVDREQAWRDRGHFFAACATAMRHILIDTARRATRKKRGGGQELRLDEQRLAVEGDPGWLLRLDGLMRDLELRDPRMVRVFECRYFVGYTNAETAEALGLSERTARRDWDRVRAWLRHELGATVTSAGGTTGVGDEPLC